MPTAWDNYRAFQELKAHEQIWFDGWELTEGTVRNWEVRDGIDGVAGMLGDNLTVANRSGEVWRPKLLGPGSFTIQLWLKGNTKREAQDAWRTLLRAVYRPHRLVQVKRRTAGGELVYANAEVSGRIEPTHLGQLAYRASITFNVPSGIWQSVTDYRMDTPASSAMPKTLYLDDFALSTAPLENLQFTIYGRITNPRLIDNTDGGIGDQLLYTGTIPSGAWIRFNAATWGIDASGTTYSHAATNPTGRRFMTIGAARPGDRPSIQLTGTNTDSKTRLGVYGKRAYLC
jgi:hypothetical protein